jgi:hypothetical protein
MPSINAVITKVFAVIVEPKMNDSSFAQTTSYIRDENPERKKRKGYICIKEYI